jgi:integrase
MRPVPRHAVPRRPLSRRTQERGFLTDLAVQGHVAAATQHPALHALVCLDTRVLKHAMEDRSTAVRAARKINVPVVMTRDAVATILSRLDGIPQLVAKRLYGSGLRSMEAVRLRVKDNDVPMQPLTVRSGTGDKDRFTTVPATVTPLLQNHLARVKTWQQHDLGFQALSPDNGTCYINLLMAHPGLCNTSSDGLW